MASRHRARRVVPAAGPARPTAGGSATARRSRGSTRRRPRRATSSRSRSATGCSSAARTVAGDGRRHVRLDRPRDRAAARRRSPARRRPTSTRRSAPRDRAQRRSWGSAAGRERAKYLFRIARILQERSREFAVLESMDSGKPIKESRDVDVPLAAAHFWYYAGWADKLEYAFPGRVAKPLGVAAQIIPWNFPLLMLAWKIAPALAAGNTVVLKPASTTPLSRAALRRGLPPGRPAAGRRQHRHRVRARSGCRSSTHPDVDKVAFTGSTEIGKKIGRGVAGTDKALTLELGGKAANIVFDDAPLDQAVEGIVNGIYFNQGEVCCAGSRLLVQESIAETAHRQAQGPPVDDPGRRPARQEHRRRGDQLEGPAREDHRARRVGRRRGRRAVPAGLRPARARLLLPADAVHERRPEPSDRPRGDLRAGAVGADVPDARRGRREGQQHAVRAVGRRLDRQGLADPRDGRRGCRPASSGRTRSTSSTRRRRSVATRNRASGARAACTASTPTSASRTADGREPRRHIARRHGTAGRRRTADRRPQDVQAVHRRRRSRGPRAAARTWSPAPTARRSRTPFAPRARTSATRSARRARRVPGWAAKTAMNRGQVLYRVAELMEGRRDQFVAEVAAAEGLRAAARRRGRRSGHRPLGLVRRLGRQDRARSSARRTRSPRRTSTSRSPSRPASSASSRPRPRRCSGWSAGSRRRW